MAGLIALALSASTRFSGLAGLAGLPGQLLTVLVPAGIGTLAYLTLASVLRIEEVSRLRVMIQQRLRGSNLD
jgi:hypothetical protein